MELIQEIGSYAGLAAIPGLAILSALYFSQARDVRRLRDWAGRAPERAAEQASGGRVGPQPAAAPAATQPAAQPAARPAAAQPAQAGAAAGAATGAAAASGGGGGTATATPPRTTIPPRLTPRVPGATPAGQTSILGPAAGGPKDPWYRRLADRLPAARYIAILVVGIAVVGGGIAFGITQLGEDSGTGEQQNAKRSSAAREAKQKAAPAVQPEDVTVSVFNGTAVDGLARTIGTQLEEDGFEVGDLVTASEGQVAESVVLFKEGANREAQLVARKLDISQIEPADAESIAQAGTAEVIVLAGADLAEQQ